MGRYTPRYVIEAEPAVSTENFDVKDMMVSLEGLVALTKLQANLEEIHRPLKRSEQMIANSFVSAIQRDPLNLSMESVHLAHVVDVDVSMESVGEKVKGFLKAVVAKIVAFFKWVSEKFKSLFNSNKKAQEQISQTQGKASAAGKKAYTEFKQVSEKLQKSENKEVAAVAREATQLAEQGKVKEAKAKVQEVIVKLRDDMKHGDKRAKAGGEVDQYLKDQGDGHTNSSVVNDMIRLGNVLRAAPDPKTQSMRVHLSSKSYANYISNIKDLQPVCNVGSTLANHCKVTPGLTKDMVAGLNMKYDREIDVQERRNINIVQSKVGREFAAQIGNLEKDAGVKQYFDVKVEKATFPRLHLTPKPDREASSLWVSLEDIDRYTPILSKALNEMGVGLKMAATANAFSKELLSFTDSAGEDKQMQLQAQFLQAFMGYVSTLTQSTMRINYAISGFAIETTSFVKAHLK